MLVECMASDNVGDEAGVELAQWEKVSTEVSTTSVAHNGTNIVYACREKKPYVGVTSTSLVKLQLQCTAVGSTTV